jgi:hypothetical protein
MNLDSFLTNILRLQSPANLQDLHEKRVTVLVQTKTFQPQARTTRNFVTTGHS